MVKRSEIDFTKGPLLKKLIIYALPIIGVNLLQILFTATDVAMLGIFTNDMAVAAVGASATIINLLLGFLLGMSVATNVLVARAMGSKDKEHAGHLVGTSVALSVVFGLVITVVGILLSEKLLVWTNCDPEVLPYATKYLKIYLLGTPIIMLYNFCAAILRAVGDTLRPLLFLLMSGFANIALNAFFILVLGWDVEGVAIATVSSQALSAVFSLVLMVRNDGYANLSISKIRLSRRELFGILQIGVPMGISKVSFSIANVVIYSRLNLLGADVMAANAICKEIEGFMLEIMHGFSLAAIAIISQNLGAKKMPRIKKTIMLSLLLTSVVGASLGVGLFFTREFFCGIMSDTQIVIEYAAFREAVVGCLYVICGLANVFQESIRGLGYSNTSLAISITANIVFRIFWILVIYPLLAVEGDIMRNYLIICLVWPISWAITALLGAVVLIFLYKKTKKRVAEASSALAT